MSGLALNDGSGCLGMCYGRAGRGKTRTAQWYTANNGCVYVRAMAIWKNSELAFLQTLCRELGVVKPPNRKIAAYDRALEVLSAESRPVFIDEFEKLPRFFLEIVRDLSDMSGCHFVLVGEDELVGYLSRDRRAWSRVFQSLEFKPIETADIMLYASESSGMKFSIDMADYLHRESGGDFRLVKRYMLMIYQVFQTDPKNGVTVDMVKPIVKSSLKGR